MNTIDHPRSHDLPVDGSSGSETDVAERRRPGRLEEVDASLVPLLRTPCGGGLTGLEPVFDDHVGTPMLGVLWGVLFSIPLWCGLILAVRAILH